MKLYPYRFILTKIFLLSQIRIISTRLYPQVAQFTAHILWASTHTSLSIIKIHGFKECFALPLLKSMVLIEALVRTTNDRPTRDKDPASGLQPAAIYYHSHHSIGVKRTNREKNHHKRAALERNINKKRENAKTSLVSSTVFFRLRRRLIIWRPWQVPLMTPLVPLLLNVVFRFYNIFVCGFDCMDVFFR